MANREAMMKQIQRLNRLHPQFKLTPEILDDYFSVLEECLPEYLEMGVQILIATSKYFPKPAEILQAHETAMLKTIESRVGTGNANRIIAS